MATTFKYIFTRIFIITAIILYVVPVHAQLTANNYKKLKLSDSSGQYLVNTNNITAINNSENDGLGFYEKDSKVVESLASAIKKPQERRKLMGYLKQLTSNNDANYNRSGGRFYYHLANTFARLHFYPLAMKCFLKTIKYRQETDTLSSQDIISSKDSTNISSGYLSVNSNDDSVLNKQHFTAANTEGISQNSKAIDVQSIINLFNDGKKAAAYAILFHVKQPVPGKRKIFKFTNTGHTFITLIKYNADSTYTSLSFGFYPHKDNLLSATPLEPSTSSIFKDDSNHQWDEVLGKFISKRRFEKILSLTVSYSAMKYHLSKNNCTDFGIDAAALAGIEILDTSGKWPLGGGNNPAVTGQSILQHKFNDSETGGARDIFIDVSY